jgi:hypothetical protein
MGRTHEMYMRLPAASASARSEPPPSSPSRSQHPHRSPDRPGNTKRLIGRAIPARMDPQSCAADTHAPTARVPLAYSPFLASAPFPFVPARLSLASDSLVARHMRASTRTHTRAIVQCLRAFGLSMNSSPCCSHSILSGLAQALSA